MARSSLPNRRITQFETNKRKTIAHVPSPAPSNGIHPVTPPICSNNASTSDSNIHVYVRCRSRNQREIEEKSSVVISTLGPQGKEIILSNGAHQSYSSSKKTYQFDQVFGAESDQETVFNATAKNYIREMLHGYNCTIFAYGQTGTGKTYTMSGDINILGDVQSTDNLLLGEHAGIIPRVLVDLFKELSSLNKEYSVKISFLELYNENLKDLLSDHEEDDSTVNDSKRQIRIFDNNNNNSSIMVKGMQEIFINSAHEGLNLLMQGSLKRKVAATKCNDLSSRSHTVFTITTNIIEQDSKDHAQNKNFVKIGKLNLVDLAGSENINRSGAENKRAQEAGLINKSLLTLGRVINALVDHSNHIPYRESKLTRLLQDSLGGMTKTCIIATVSPAKISMEETASTLEYATRAKSIKNTPQVNQSLSKDTCLKDYIQEIEKLRNDLRNSRNKQGIFITQDQLDLYESNSILIDEQNLKIHNLREQIKKFKENYLSQLDVNKFLQSEKEKLADIIRNFNVDFSNFDREIQKIHHDNLELIEIVTQQRDLSQENSQKQYSINQDLQLKMSQQILQTLSTLQISLMNYNSRFSQVFNGVTEELSHNVNTHKIKHDATLESLFYSTTNLLTIKMNELVSNISDSLKDFQNDSVSHYDKDLDEIYQSHQNFLKSLQKDIKSCLDSVGCSILTSINEISQTCGINLNKMNDVTKNHQSVTERLIEEQNLQIKKLKNDLITERKISNRFNRQLTRLKEYFQDHVSRSRNELHEELNEFMSSFKDKQSNLDQDIWQNTASIFNETDKEVDRIYSDSLTSLAQNTEDTLKMVSNNSTRFTNDLTCISDTMNVNISSRLKSLPINEFLNKISQTLCACCGDNNSAARNPILNSIKKFQSTLFSDIELTNGKIVSLVDEIVSQINAISNKSNIDLTILNENFNSLYSFMLNDYKENIMQISKTQDEVLSDHGENFRSLYDQGMEILTTHGIENPGDKHPQPELAVIKILPALKFPKELQIYRDAEDNNKDDTTNSNSYTGENVMISQISPKTPVPVPDQPLQKVLVPKSINSTKSKRSKTLPTTDDTGQESQNNLKRRFTAEPVFKGEETRKNDMLQTKKIHQ
ncbi:kip1p [Saccharomyces arboricola H-6]|uniref:Kinesin-like protein KIP1 n=1 Tax=Saccharomyces arboricola (strain H-6 / AS 2.3317 / CBS 10644) TaxID=1160507 RepID=J8LR63_SACAR|nr:kip1p [Saccharomyces arboricola H-6]